MKRRVRAGEGLHPITTEITTGSRAGCFTATTLVWIIFTFDVVVGLTQRGLASAVRRSLSTASSTESVAGAGRVYDWSSEQSRKYDDQAR